MTRLVHLGVPPRREELKAELGAAMPIGGAQVAESALVEALLRHRPLPQICFVPTTTEPIEQARERLAGYPGWQGSEIVSAADLAALPGRSVIFQNSPRLFEAAGLRSLWGRPDWPIVGITHSLSVLDGSAAALFAALPSGHIRPFDRLICTSLAGEIAFACLTRQASAASGAHNAVPLRTTVIPLGIDVERFTPGTGDRHRAELGIAGNETVFLYVGRFSAEFKMDPFPLLASFATALRGRPQARLILAGDTAGGGHLRIADLGKALGIGDRVTVVPDPSPAAKLRLYQAADVFVSFSDNLQETFGLTVLEAMSCGLPVVATAWSGYRETVVHGETGFLVPTTWRSGDDHSSRLSPFLSEAATHLRFSREVSFDIRVAAGWLRRLAHDPRLRATLGAAGRRRAVSRYGWNVVADSYRVLLRGLLDEAASAPGAAGQAACRYPPFGYDHQAAFGHFATDIAGLPDYVRRTPDAGTYAAAVSLVAPSAAEAIAAACGAGEPVATSGVFARLAELLGDPHEASTAVQLLLKYGVVASA